MTEAYDWSAFYPALCRFGPRLLVGIDDGVRDVIAMVAAAGDRFWSDDLQDPLAAGARSGDLRSGVVAVLGLWRENVLQALADDFGVELEWRAITVDAGSPLVDRLVEAATPEPS